MQDPIPIKRDMPENEISLTADEYLRYMKQRSDHRIQIGFLVFLGLLVAGFCVPLIVFLTRLALGG